MQSRSSALSRSFSTLRSATVRALAISLICLVPPTLHAQSRDREVKARLGGEGSGSLRKVNFEPLSLRGGSKLTLISPQAWAPLAERIRGVLQKAHEGYTSLLGDIPAFSTAIRLMDEDTFFITTGAPRWTNAMYYRNQIIIPLGTNSEIDMDGLTRAVRHEYTHAVIHALSGGRCPGWLDEGLAQWAEGSENPALRPALREWVKTRGPVSLSLLQGGFTKLDQAMVPAAYAESLYATYVVLNSFGFDSIRKYLDALRDGESKERAFLYGFETSEALFERKLSKSLNQWAVESKPTR